MGCLMRRVGWVVVRGRVGEKGVVGGGGCGCLVRLWVGLMVLVIWLWLIVVVLGWLWRWFVVVMLLVRWLLEVVRGEKKLGLILGGVLLLVVLRFGGRVGVGRLWSC